eukprot:1536411-Lingulodinium_polyedra.AAC.1
MRNLSTRAPVGPFLPRLTTPKTPLMTGRPCTRKTSLSGTSTRMPRAKISRAICPHSAGDAWTFGAR